MIRKFAIATFVLTAALVTINQFGVTQQDAAPPERPSASSADESWPDEQVGDLSPIQGLKPLPEIIEFWQGRADTNPTDYPSRTELGFALNTAAGEAADLELYREAEAVFGQALDLNPSYDKARLGLASSLTAQHRFDEALQQLDMITPPATAADRSETPPVLALRGDAHLGVGEYEKATVVYEQLVVAERSAPTVSRLARLRFEQGTPAEAVELATEALRLSEDLALRPNTTAFYHFQLAHFLFLGGDNVRSIEAYRSALLIDPDHGGAAEGLAFALASTGQLADAAEAYQQLIDRSPAADLHGLYADVLQMLGETELAAEQERLGRTAAAESRDDPAERRHLVGYHLSRDPGLAVELARADLQDRQDTGGYDALAWALHHDGQHVAAAEAIDLALASGTRHPAVLYHAAAIYDAPDADRSSAEAAQFLDDALAINPDFHPTERNDAFALADRLLAR